MKEEELYFLLNELNGPEHDSTQKEQERKAAANRKIPYCLPETKRSGFDYLSHSFNNPTAHPAMWGLNMLLNFSK